MSVITMGQRAGIYIRKSRKDKDKVSHRLAAQRENLPAYAQSQGWRYEVYDDDHASACRGKIGGLQQRARLESDIRNGKIDIVLVIELSRLSRDESMQDYTAWLQLCIENSVKLALPGRTLDPSDQNDWLLLIMLGGFNSAEVKQTKARMKDGYDHLYLAGKFLGGTPPLPYKLAGRRLPPVVDESELLRMQALWRKAETMSAKAISIELGMPEIAVRRALGDDRLLFYQSLRLVPQTGNYIRCAWEPVMNAAQAGRIKASRRTRKNGDSKRGEAASLLTNLGIYYCGYCGKTIKIHYNSKQRKDGTRLYYYGCKGGCQKSRLIAQPLANAMIIRNVFGTLRNLEILKQYWLEEHMRIDPSKELADLTIREKTLAVQKDRLVTAVAEKLMEAADIREKMAAIKVSLQEIEVRRHDLMALKTNEPDWSALDFTNKDFCRLTITDRRLFIKAVISRIEVYESYMLVTYLFPRQSDGDCSSRIHLPPPQRGTSTGRMPRIHIP